MTYRLLSTRHAEPSSLAGTPSTAANGDLTPLFAPASLIRACEILRDRTLIPDIAGIYGWWFDTPLPGVLLDGTLAIGKNRLLYVGIAPRKPSAAGSASKSTLRHRISRNHLGNRIGSSTLRRSLASLLREELSLAISRPGRKAMMSREHENLLTEWMIAHASVSILPHDCAWDIEEQLVALGAPLFPLNMRGANHEFVSTLRALRNGIR